MKSEIGISSKIYPVRVYIGKNNNTSIHFGLVIKPQDIVKIKLFNLLSCKKKMKKLYKILQE